MSEVANTQETENIATVSAPVEKPKEWKAYDGRVTGRNPRERQGWQTNGEYANTQDHFKKACEAAGTAATARQASKYRMKKGLAYEAHIRAKNAA